MTNTDTTVAHTAVSQDRILCIGKRFYTNKDTLVEKFGRVYRLPALWADEGAKVLLWLVDYHTRTHARQESGGFQVFSAPAIGFSSLKALFRAIRLRPDIVVASGDCYVGLMGWMIARVCGAKFVFDIYDKYDEFAGYRRLPGFDPFEFLRKRADLKLFCSRGLMRAYGGEQSSGPSLFVANGVDETMFRPMTMAKCRSALDLVQDRLLVGYFGSMEPDRGVGDLLAAIELLRSEGLDLELLVCGKPDSSTPLDRSWIIFRGMVAHEHMPLYLNSCDLLAIPYRESPIMEMGASCKIAEYLMCGRPFVSTSTGNFTSNFPTQAAELGPGMCPPGDVAALASAIRFQLSDARLLTRPMDMAWTEIAKSALAGFHAAGMRSS